MSWSRGSSSVTFLRLCSRAPWMTRRSVPTRQSVKGRRHAPARSFILGRPLRARMVSSGPWTPTSARRPDTTCRRGLLPEGVRAGVRPHHEPRRPTRPRPTAGPDRLPRRGARGPRGRTRRAGCAWWRRRRGGCACCPTQSTTTSRGGRPMAPSSPSVPIGGGTDRLWGGPPTRPVRPAAAAARRAGVVEEHAWSPDGPAIAPVVAGAGAERSDAVGSGTVGGRGEAPPWLPEVEIAPTKDDTAPTALLDRPSGPAPSRRRRPS